VLYTSWFSKQPERAPKRLEIQLFYPRAESILQICAVPFLPPRRLPPAPSSGQRAVTRCYFGRPLPLPGAGPSHVPVATKRGLCPSAWHSAVERGERVGAKREHAGGREMLATLTACVKALGPRGTHFHIIYNYLFALIASSLLRLSWAQEEEKLIN